METIDLLFVAEVGEIENSFFFFFIQKINK